MEAKLLVLLVAFALVPTAAILATPEASAHYVCVDGACECPPNNEGTHVHVDPWQPDACTDL